jgi:hypothetical protein
MIFEFIKTKGKEEVIIDDRISSIPEIEAIITKYGKESKAILSYIAFMYDINSPYYELLPGDRDKILRMDFFKQKEPKCLNDIVVLACINKIVDLVTTPEQRILEAYKGRVEKAIQVITEKETTEDNIDDFLKDTKNLNALLELRYKIGQLETFNKLKGVKKRGGKEINDFEDRDFV